MAAGLKGNTAAGVGGWGGAVEVTVWSILFSLSPSFSVVAPTDVVARNYGESAAVIGSQRFQMQPVLAGGRKSHLFT